jgi:hypothetical protein
MTAPDHIAETALLTVSQWQRTARNARDAQFEHRAQRIAADLYDERRDLEPHEQQLLTDVHRIGRDYVRVCGEANRSLSPSGALAVEFTARARRQERYQGALERYESQKEAVAESCDERG